MKTKREKFEVIGSITVDAGIVQIGDPCYQYDNHDMWLKYLDDTGILNMEGVLPIPHESEQGNYGHCSKAVVVTSGFGDGVYEVLAKKCKETGRVKEVKIKFF